MIKYSIKAIKITLNKVTGKYHVNSKEFMKKKSYENYAEK